ncbi:MAG TPA: cytochrome c oxidase subunit II [Solirubrobacteraceae bacterium]|jgi:cytochrome c oxidase subunit 2
MLLGAVAIGGCGAQSTLDTHSRPAREIADLWWWMLAAAVVVLLGAIALLAVGWRQRHHAGLIGLGRLERHTTGLVVTFGILVPLIVVTAVFAIANFSVASVTNAPAVGSTSMTIDVTGHQWFWEVRYPGRGVVTANEIHIPVGTRINAVLRTADVIHSFWVPSLNRKADMIPGYPNRILLYADKPGVYRGQCAEFCGIEHANMATTVIAESAARFKAWLAHNAQPAASPVTPQQRAGLRVFEASSCASCHTIAGTPAHGEIGPDLTHVGGRTTLAALTIPNTPAQMRDWILHPQRIKPGNRMPDLALTAPDADALVAYLESLR